MRTHGYWPARSKLQPVSKYEQFLLFFPRKPDLEGANIIQHRVKVYLGATDLEEDPGDEYKAVGLYTHPERIKLEKEHRAGFDSGGGMYEPYAGPYDLTLVKLDRKVEFVQGKVTKLSYFYCG